MGRPRTVTDTSAFPLEVFTTWSLLGENEVLPIEFSAVLRFGIEGSGRPAAKE